MRTFLAVAFIAVVNASAGGANEARDILDRRKHLEETTRRWEDLSQKTTLRVFYRGGGRRESQLEAYERRFPGDERKTIVFVLSPAEVKGTGFLSFVHPGRAPEQWLYLPDIKRVRQVAANTRNESFVGSDLTYRDMNLLAEMPSWSDEDAAASLRGEDTVEGVACHLIELTPKRDDIGYKRILLWVGKEDLVPRKLELYEDQGEPRKRIQQKDVRLVGAIPVAYRTEVETPPTGSRTEVEITEVKFDQGLQDDLFTQRQLERGGR
jgi:outer membrane lipoprotein-sorting protein